MDRLFIVQTPISDLELQGVMKNRVTNDTWTHPASLFRAFSVTLLQVVISCYCLFSRGSNKQSYAQ
jgi:hypothetical protein